MTAAEYYSEGAPTVKGEGRKGAKLAAARYSSHAGQPPPVTAATGGARAIAALRSQRMLLWT